MAAQSYKPVYWGVTEPTSNKKLNDMANNDQWLFENTPRMSYNSYGVRKSSGLKIATGTILFPPFVTSTTKDAEFGSFFSTACNPVVVVGGPIAPYGRLWPIVRGLGNLQPDHRGFTCTVYTFEGNRMLNNFYVPWIAIGF